MQRKTIVLLASIGVGIVMAAAGLAISSQMSQSIGNALILAGIIISATPYSIYSYFLQNRAKKMEDHFPSFLKDIAESKKSGYSLPKVFAEAARRDYGALNPEIRKTAIQLSWDIPFPEVLEKLGDRVKDSKLISRSITILLQSYRSGGNIAHTLETLARDSMRIKDSEEKRKAVISRHMMTIYIIFVLFVGIVIVLYKFGIVAMLGIETEGEFLGGSVNMCTIETAQPLCSLCPVFGFGNVTDKFCYYKVLFMFMIVVQGISNGLVAGQITHGQAVAGVKHSLFMSMTGLIVYLLLI